MLANAGRKQMRLPAMCARNMLRNSACSECQRRKQKCNREWPCHCCQRRKVADKCHFGHSQSSPGKIPSQNLGRKRQLDDEECAEFLESSSPSDDANSEYEAPRYTALHTLARLDTNSARETTFLQKSSKQYFLDAGSCFQLKRALQLLTPRPYIDSLVENFLNDVNYHYYIIHPPSFLKEYLAWWSTRSENRPLGLQWTCLLLMVCACSTQHADIELRRKLASHLGKSTQKLPVQYHDAARELHSVIPVAAFHLFTVQSLLHSCYWYKSEARFVESWHVLNAAIREAQELGSHQESAMKHMAEFDREMRRRVWCVLNTWDWQLSALLSRSMIIDRADCDVRLPNLALEGYTPSPLLHMKLQSEVIDQISRCLGQPQRLICPTDIQAYQAILEGWMATFPLVYGSSNPDKSSDVSRPWIVLHRHYLHTMTYSMALYPIRAYLGKPMTRKSPFDELKIRSDGINYSLQLMAALQKFADHVYPRDTKIHDVLFGIFDTAVILCSAIIHDQDNSVPRRFEILEAVDKAVAILKHLSMATNATSIWYKTLLEVIQRISRPAPIKKTPPNRLREKPKVEKQAPTSFSRNQQEAVVISNPGCVLAQISRSTHSTDTFAYRGPIVQSTIPGHYSICNGAAMYTRPEGTALVPRRHLEGLRPAEKPACTSAPLVD